MNTAIYAIFIILCFFSCGCSTDTSQPGYEIPIMADMKHAVPYEAYSKNPVFKDGKTAQSPVQGTFHRKALISEGDNPIPISPEVISRGEHLYNNYCYVCHGKSGDGDGPLIPRYTNPPLFTSQRLMKMSSREMYHIITHGKRDMPSHAGQIEEVDRWKLIHYVEKLQGKAK